MGLEVTKLVIEKYVSFSTAYRSRLEIHVSES